MRRLYFDYAATTPLDPEIRKAMEPFLTENFGNPNSIHFFGQQARAAVDEAREKILAGLNLPAAEFRRFIFTASATEADNLALRGTVKRFYEKNRDDHFLPARLIISGIEHEAVLATAEDLQAEGVELVILSADKTGRIDLNGLKNNLNRRTALVSVITGNNEIGRIEPVKEIGRIIADYRRENPGIYPLFHTDAVQSFQYLPTDPVKDGIDLLSISGHKIYGPKGGAGLYCRDLDLISPLITGGGQEFNRRSGTENVAGIVGLAAAAGEAVRRRERESSRLAGLKKYFWRELKTSLPAVERTVETDSLAAEFLPHILNLRLPGRKAEEIVFRLDQAGLAISAGSACASRSLQPSRTVRVLGYSENIAAESFRFSFGRETEKAGLAEAVRRMVGIFG
jgi:cysteine desulfurase